MPIRRRRNRAIAVVQQDNGELAEDLLGRVGPFDVVDESGVGSFPASDPPSSWAGQERPERPVSPHPQRVVATAPVPDEGVRHELHDQT
jgi:hypothetical protein